jgi:RimJ/RimL family protein N-acetyltransferase
LLEYAFRLRNVQKVWLTVNSDNERALRSYERCGFVEEGRLRKQVWNNGRYIDLVYMGVLREEWEASFAGGQLLEQGGENRGMARESKH